MHNLLTRWLLFGLLLAWALSHATVFGQQDNKASPMDKIRQGLDKTITVDYSGQSLADVLNHIRDKSGLSINLDQTTLLQVGINPDDNLGPVNIKAANDKVGQVLRKFLNAHRLTYIVCEGAILVTTEDMASIRQMRQRTSVDLEDVPLKKAVRDLARQHGINLVIDPRIAKQAETPVSLQLDNTGLETTIRLLAELANVKAVRMGNVMFVTSEERAKKIREEEAHQFENIPLNPNFPVFGAAGAFGGFGGIAAPPMRAVPAVPPVVVPGPPPGIELPQAPPPAKDAPMPKN